MFPTADQPPDEGDQQDPKDRPGQVRDSATVSPQKPGEGATRPGSGHVPRTEIQREPYRAQASNPSAARRAVQPGDKPERVTPRPVSARPWSGGPFRP
jgi:hypothetical protein